MERKSDIALRIEEFDWKARQNWAKERLKTELIKYVGGLQNRAEMYAEIGRIRRDLENSLRRWAYTMETHRVVQNSLAEMREVGISSYRIVAEEDEKTTDLCQILDGEVFDINEASVGINLPPFHFHCRCRVEQVDAFTLSRDEEIELIMAFLRYVSEWGNEEGGWRTRLATEQELRRIAEDLVDLLRVFEEFVDENGFFNILNEDVFERYGAPLIQALVRLSGRETASMLDKNHMLITVERLHDAFSTGKSWPYVNAEILFQLAMVQAVPNSGRQNAVEIGAGFIVVGGLLIGLPSLVSWLGSPAAITAAGGANTTVAAMYWERIKAWLGMGGGDRLVSTRPSSASVVNKLHGYLLNPSHPTGQHKAELFRRTLGYTQNNMHRLAEQLVFNPMTARATELTQHGQKFVQYIQVLGANGRVVEVKTVWIRNLDGIVRLVTAYPS